MTRARRNASRKQTRRPADRSGLTRLRPWLLAALAALSVARPLLPSEGVAWMGDGLPFDLLWMLLAAAYFLLAIAQGCLARRWNLIDLAVVALVVLSATSAYLGAQH